MGKDRPTDPTREARAEAVIENVWKFHELGKRAAKYVKNNPGFHALPEFVEQERISADAARKAKRFAKEYTKADVEAFCELRNADGLPLTSASGRADTSAQPQATEKAATASPGE